MSTASQKFRVAHCLSLKGIADSASVAAATGLSVKEVEKQAVAIVEDDAVVWRSGAISGWQLTAAGRKQDSRDVESALEAAHRAVVEGCYAGFVLLNQELLETCTAWQVREAAGQASVPNDDSESPQESAIVGRLQAINRAIQPIVSVLGVFLSWFDQYPRRLSSALACVEAGQAKWFASPLVDSYHMVWFELHEDLLSALGLERSS